MPGAWVHIMQHASNHRPATIDANIQLSAWLTVEAAEGLLSTITALLLVLCKLVNFQINTLINMNTHYLENDISTASSFMKQAVSTIQTLVHKNQ